MINWKAVIKYSKDLVFIWHSFSARASACLHQLTGEDRLMTFLAGHHLYMNLCLSVCPKNPAFLCPPLLFSLSPLIPFSVPLLSYSVPPPPGYWDIGTLGNGTLRHLETGTPGPRTPGPRTLGPRDTGTLGHWGPGTLGPRDTGTPGHKDAGIPGQWDTGKMGGVGVSTYHNHVQCTMCSAFLLP